jgi:hypothetical protein
MIEELIFKLDRYLDDSWLDGAVAAVMAGAATAALRLAVEFWAGSS